jgi:2-keto-3-deoxy-L-rhamnonate aldolase RhmA
MKSRLTIAVVVIILLGTTILAQKKRQHFNPMIDQLEDHKVVVGGVAASFPRPQAAGGGGRGAGALNAEAANTTPAPDACGLTPAPRGAGGGGGRGAGAPGNAPGAPGATPAGANAAGRGADAAANRGGAGGGGGRGAGGGGFTPPAPAAQTMDEAAKLTVAYKAADFLNQSMEGGVDNAIGPFSEFMKALQRAGVLEKTPYPHLTHPYYVKTPKISRDPAKAIQNISKQLNTGMTGVIFVGVDCAKEVQLGLAAMRPKSKGGTRPGDYGDAPDFWGMNAKDYERKADVWGLNPDGELVNWTIIESREGLKNAREIAKVKGIGVLIPGSGTLRGVLRDDPDPEAWEKAQQTVLAACKEFKVNCGYPASTPAEIEMRQKQGFNVFVLQNWSQQSFDTIAKGRELGGRPATNQ